MHKVFLSFFGAVFLCRAIAWLPNRSAATLSFAQQTNPRLIEVRADQPWNDSGLEIQSGDLLIIRYVSGLWSPWSGGVYDALGFGGDPNCDCNVLRGVSHAALIAKVGDGAPFFVGQDFRHRMGEAGKLYLGINDVRLSDNSGSLWVQVEVWR
ncbi:MAG: hypothetical protein ANABAC_2154 [Anaerolineae bacterium]|jgi:hypothetical protein|nr:MAG: hypothetical protein ANABAC_2154 [Anaerolineae bacterium]